jgi:hypothetical protein
MLFAFLGIYEPRDLYHSVYCIDPRRPDKFQYGGIPRRSSIFLLRGPFLAAPQSLKKKSYLTADNQMTPTPNLALNAEIESSDRAANSATKLHGTPVMKPHIPVLAALSVASVVACWSGGAFGQITVGDDDPNRIDNATWETEAIEPPENLQ